MTRTFFKFPLWLIVSALLSTAIFAQDDGDPNSPQPELLAASDPTRVLAVDSRRRTRGIPSSGQLVFTPSPDSVVTIYVRGPEELLPGETANAFRVFVKQRSGKTFEMESLAIERSAKNVISVKFRLHDVWGFRGQPVADGDSLIYATWRGNATKMLKIGLGSTGGMQIPAESALFAPAQREPESVGYRFAGDRIRLAEQAAFGPSTAFDNRLRRIGIRTWIADQFTLPYPTLAYPDLPQVATNPPSTCQITTHPSCYRDHYTMMPLQRWFFREALYGEAQLRHRTTWTLWQIWVTSGVAITQSSHALSYQKILADNAFGNYRELMQDVTLSPTMGQYLDMVRSTKTNPNENYPREILQLFSIGLNQLNPDGTPKRDGSGNVIPTYDQDTVNNFAKVFTGWSFCNFTCEHSEPSIINYMDPMTLIPANHDLTEKHLLNYPNAPHSVIPACANCTTDEAIKAYAEDSLDKALDNIFNHPNVGPFIGKLFIQHMVTSDPSPAYVARVTSAFDGGGGTPRGDMKSLLRAVLLDPEARGDLKTAPRYGKLREPVQLITNLARIFPARDFIGEGPSDGGFASYLANMDQDPFNSPTVFNYFSPEFVIPGTTVLAPEFELLNTGTGVKRSNFLHIFIFEGLSPNATDSLRGTKLDFSEFVPLAESDPSGGQLMDALNAKMMHGGLVAAQRDTILSAIVAVPASDPVRRVKTAAYLIAASSQYQVQR